MTADARRKRAWGNILLLAAGLLVLTAISAGSVHLVNMAREDDIINGDYHIHWLEQYLAGKAEPAPK